MIQRHNWRQVSISEFMETGLIVQNIYNPTSFWICEQCDTSIQIQGCEYPNLNEFLDPDSFGLVSFHSPYVRYLHCYCDMQIIGGIIDS